MKIAVIGASSTGKSKLAKALFDHFHMENVINKHLTVNARQLLQSMNFSNRYYE